MVSLLVCEGKECRQAANFAALLALAPRDPRLHSGGMPADLRWLRRGLSGFWEVALAETGTPRATATGDQSATPRPVRQEVARTRGPAAAQHNTRYRTNAIARRSPSHFLATMMVVGFDLQRCVRDVVPFGQQLSCLVEHSVAIRSGRHHQVSGRDLHL